jgi:ubiquinone/menaquinone biosynthesis C-methylase UbiE
MELTDPAKLKAQKTFDAAADLFDGRPLGFWARYGERTVARLKLKPGATVLEVACGTGASAKRRGLENVEFRYADMTALGYPDSAFDAVVCVFGIFFVKDMESLTAEGDRI